MTKDDLFVAEDGEKKAEHIHEKMRSLKIEKNDRNQISAIG